MSDCRRKYSVLGIADNPCALPFKAQEFVRFLTDINFFGGNVDPWKGAVGIGAFGGVPRSQGSVQVTRSGAERSLTLGVRRKIPFGNSVS
jgi:hypothetical protein